MFARVAADADSTQTNRLTCCAAWWCTCCKAVVNMTPTRLIHVDALRGFALLGILGGGIRAFADPYYVARLSNPDYASTADHWVRRGFHCCSKPSSTCLFSFPVRLQLYLCRWPPPERAEAGVSYRALGAPGNWRCWPWGSPDRAPLYYGEILSTWTHCLAWSLPAARKSVAGHGMSLGVGLVTVACSACMALGVLQALAGDFSATSSSEASTKLAAFSGSALETLRFHSAHLWQTVQALWLLQGPSALAMFFFGYAAGRNQLLVTPYRWQPHLRRLLLITLAVGLPGALIYAVSATYAPGGGLETFAFGLGQLTAPLLSAAYAMSMLALFSTAAGARLCQWSAPMGKMARELPAAIGAVGGAVQRVMAQA